MSDERSAIFEWAEAGRLRADGVDAALLFAGATPDAAAWRRFVDRLLLGAGRGRGSLARIDRLALRVETRL